MQRIIAWHMITGETSISPDEKEAPELRNNYIRVLESGFLLPPSHRKDTIFIRNPTIFGLDSLAGDDDYIFLSLMPFETRNYFLMQAEDCKFGPESQSFPKYGYNWSTEWVYGNCELRNFKLQPKKSYGFGFDAEELVQNGALFGTKDLIGVYRRHIESLQEALHFVGQNIELLNSNFLTHDSFNRYKLEHLHDLIKKFQLNSLLQAADFDPDVVKLILTDLDIFLGDLLKEKTGSFKSSNALINQYLHVLASQLQNKQNIFRYSGEQAIEQLRLVVSNCLTKFTKYVSKFGDSWKPCTDYDESEILHPGFLTLEKAIYFIEAGKVYHKSGKLVSEPTPIWEPVI